MLEFLTYKYMQNAFMAGIMISILCPLLGTFVVLRRFSGVGDTLSHSAFAGVATGLLFSLNPTYSALTYTVLSALLLEYLRKKYSSYQEIVLAIVLTLNVGIAIIISSTGKLSTNINQFLFGSILTVSNQDIIVISIVLVLSLIFVILRYNQLVYITFDDIGAQVHGVKSSGLGYILAALTGATVGVSMRIIGLLVVSSILIIPVAGALNLKYGFKKTMISSVILGLLSVLSGLILSYFMNSAPGGTIAVVSVFLLIITLLIGRRKVSQ